MAPRDRPGFGWPSLGFGFLVASPFLRRVAHLPDDDCRLSVDDLSKRLRDEHKATLLAISRGGQTRVNPPADFVLQPMDDALVVAESLGTLQPLHPHRAMATPA